MYITQGHPPGMSALTDIDLVDKIDKSYQNFDKINKTIPPLLIGILCIFLLSDQVT